MSKANRVNEMSEKMSDINLELNEITKFRLDEIKKVKILTMKLKREKT